MTARRRLRIRLVAIDPPFDGDGVRFGVQAGRDVEDPVPASATTEFDIDLDVVTSEGGDHDFAGRYVHGRPGDRFLYLSWGFADADRTFEMFARAKVRLSDIPIELLERTVAADATLVCDLRATDDRGRPASGTVRPPALRWR